MQRGRISKCSSLVSVDSAKGQEEVQQNQKGLEWMSLHCLMAPQSNESLTQV